MGKQVLPALVLIASTVVLAGGTALLPPGLYDTQDPEEQARLVEEHRDTFNLAQPLNVLAGVLVAVGFGLLAARMRGVASAWILGLGALAFLLGTISASIFIYLQSFDPQNAYAGAYSIWETSVYWSWLAGLALFGVAFLQAGLPSWIGYLTAGSALLYSVLYLVTGAGFMVPFLEALLAVLIAVVLLTR